MTGVEVYCTIRNCHYWAEGEHCSAAKILITTDEIGRIYPEAADAGAAHDLTRQHGPTEARTCMETCCKTFTPRGQGRPSGTPDQRGAAAPATRQGGAAAGRAPQTCARNQAKPWRYPASASARGPSYSTIHGPL